jgi:hypothetical protein
MHVYAHIQVQSPARDQKLAFCTQLLIHENTAVTYIHTFFPLSTKVGNPEAAKLTMRSWLRNTSLSTLLTLLMALMYKPRIK